MRKEETREKEGDRERLRQKELRGEKKECERGRKIKRGIERERTQEGEILFNNFFPKRFFLPQSVNIFIRRSKSQ